MGLLRKTGLLPESEDNSVYEQPTEPAPIPHTPVLRAINKIMPEVFCDGVNLLMRMFHAVVVIEYKGESYTVKRVSYLQTGHYFVVTYFDFRGEEKKAILPEFQRFSVYFRPNRVDKM